MMRLLSTTLLCALGTAQASAQTAVSQQLLELDDDERNAAFTRMLRDSRKCNQIASFKRRPRRGCVSGASTPRANPEGSQAQDAIGKTEMAVVVPMKSPLRAKQVFACC